jgi:hypothetical protein
MKEWKELPEDTDPKVVGKAEDLVKSRAGDLYGYTNE